MCRNKMRRHHNSCRRQDVYLRSLIPTLVSLMCAALSVATTFAAPVTSGIAVKIAKVKQVVMAPESWVTGTVVGRHEVHLAAEVSGKLVMLKAVGARVKEDAVVARIDPTFVKLQVEEFTTQLEGDRTRLEWLRDEVRRIRNLVAQNSEMRTRLNELRAERDVARNELKISRARLKQAREALRRHVIRSPFAGIVAAHLLHRGERAEVGDEVLSIIDSPVMDVRARVPLDVLKSVHEGDVVRVAIDGRKFIAQVRALVVTDDEGLRMLDMRVSLDAGVGVVGQSARVSLPVVAAKTALVVPRDALVLRGDDVFVFRVNANNKLERVAVEPGSGRGSLVVVRGKLQPGDRVVIRGGEQLHSGGAVEILHE